MPLKLLSNLAAIIAIHLMLTVAHAMPAVKMSSSAIYSARTSSPFQEPIRVASDSGAYERNLQNIRTYRSALKQHTRKQEPVEWARIQHDLCGALFVQGLTVAGVLGERQKGIAIFEESVAACRLALTIRTRERMPSEWAETQHFLAVARKALGELREIVARSKK